MQHLRRITASVVIALAVLLAAPGLLHAAPQALPPGEVEGGDALGTGDGPLVNPLGLGGGTAMIREAQSLLLETGFFDGPVDGRISPALDRAVRDYKIRNGMRPDGRIDAKLLAHLRASGDALRLNRSLETARAEQTKAAREALQNTPFLKQLLEDGQHAAAKPADPTRDVSACFAAPTPACLLEEAIQSVKSVPKDDLRDWALADIVAAQSTAGLTDAALETLAHIRDPRSVIVALRAIAEHQAKTGRYESALRAAKLVPDPRRRAEAYTAIAFAHAVEGDVASARAAAAEAAHLLDGLPEAMERLSLLGRLAVTAARIGDAKSAGQRLAAARAMAEGGSALSLVAVAEAEAGDPDKALETADLLADDTQRTPVFKAAATAYADRGHLEAARKTAEAIVPARYRSVSLASVAIAQARQGDISAAEQSLEAAMHAARQIDLPYARAYAENRIIAAQLHAGMVEQALSGARLIKDPSLKAYSLLGIAGALDVQGQPLKAAAARAEAVLAVDDVIDPVARVWIYTSVAAEQMEKGNSPAAEDSLSRALALGQQIKSPLSRARALAALAKAVHIIRLR